MTIDKPDVGYFSTKGGNPFFYRIIEALFTSTFNSESNVSNKFSRAALYCSCLTASLLFSISAISSRASSAKSGPPCPSITKKADNFALIWA